MGSMCDQKLYLSLALNIGCAVGLALLTNLAILYFAPTTQGEDTSADDFPPGWLVGTVWTLLFAGMGLAPWLVAISTPLKSGAERPIGALLHFCMAYPFYTLLLTNAEMAVLGDIATTIVALVVTLDSWRSSRCASLLIFLVACWTFFTSILTWRHNYL
jgi:tryptophan-rich sensory protein